MNNLKIMESYGYNLMYYFYIYENFKGIVFYFDGRNIGLFILQF